MNIQIIIIHCLYGHTNYNNTLFKANYCFNVYIEKYNLTGI